MLRSIGKQSGESVESLTGACVVAHGNSWRSVHCDLSPAVNVPHLAWTIDIRTFTWLTLWQTGPLYQSLSSNNIV